MYITLYIHIQAEFKERELFELYKLSILKLNINHNRLLSGFLSFFFFPKALENVFVSNQMQ